MKVKLILRGYEELIFEGSPSEVLEAADSVVVDWKVRFHGEAKG